MELEILSTNNEKHFGTAQALYEESFPRIEKRDEAEQTRVMANPAFRYGLITDGGELDGIMTYWETPDFIYVEHFAILPEKRNRGKATAAMGLLKARANKPIILEIDPPVDEISERRYAFYRRNGFVMNTYRRVQAKYHIGDADFEMKLLTYPGEISAAEYARFCAFLADEVAVRPAQNAEITVRPMRDGDDRKRVGRLVYLSDRFIYPYWFDSIEDGERVIGEMTALSTLYNEKNVTVAVTSDGTIAGALVSCYAPVEEKEEHIREAFDRAGVKCDARTHEIFEAYYAKMSDDKTGYYLANLAVDPAYRGKGVASALMAKAVEGKDLCRLECVKENAGARRIYERLGFGIAGEYPGVFGVPCYTMIRKTCKK